MANEKIIKSRQQQKHDIEANWLKATNFIPIDGEIVIYDAETADTDFTGTGRALPITYARVKIGDGVNNVNDLPFLHGVGVETELGGEIFGDYVNNKADLRGHAEGDFTEAGWRSHAEGYMTLATSTSHAEGRLSQATGKGSHAEGIEAYINPSHTMRTVENIDVRNDTVIYANGYDLDVGDFIAIFKDDESGIAGFKTTDCKKVIDVTMHDGDEYYVSIIIDSPFLAENYYPGLTDDEGNIICPTDGIIPAGAIIKRAVGPIASGEASHAEGRSTLASGRRAHAEGSATIAEGDNSHAEGESSKASGNNTHAEGNNTRAIGKNSHTEGSNTEASGTNSHAEGKQTIVYTTAGHAEGYSTQAGPSTEDREKLGWTNTADKSCAHAEGNKTKAYGLASHAEGGRGIAEGNYSHVEGHFFEGTTKYYYDEDHGSYFFDDENSPVEIGEYVAVYDISTPSKKIGNARVEGIEKIFLDTAQEYGGHRFVFNFESTNSDLGISYFVKLYINHSKGAGSHTEGAGNKAVHKYSHLEGCGNISGADCQHVSGKWNTPGNYAFVVGNGGSDSDRSNAMTVDWNGNAKFAGNVKIYNNKNVATEEHVAEYISDTISLLSLSSLNSDENSIHVSQERATEWDAKSNFSGKYSDLIGTPTDLATEKYVDEKVANIQIPEDFFVLNDPIGGIGDYVFLHDFALITQHWPKICIHVFKDETTDWVFFPYKYAYEYNDEAGFDCATYYFSNGLAFIAIVEGNERVDYYSFNDGYMKLHNPIGTGSFSMNRTGSTGDYSVTLGRNNQAAAECSQAEGQDTKAWADWSHAEGYDTQVGETIDSSWGWASHAEGRDTKVFGDYSHAEGYGSYVHREISCAHAEGNCTEVYGSNAHAEGNRSIAHDSHTHAEGDATKAYGAASHAEGNQAKTYSAASHAEGYLTQAGPTEDDRSQLGWSSTADRTCAHAEGNKTKALHLASHAEGVSTIARGSASHTEGRGTVATAEFQHVQGRYNYLDSNESAGNYAHIIGGGTKKNSSGSWTEENVDRKNIHTVDWNGNAFYAGKIEANGIILKSSTPNSTKRFLLTINDNGEINTTEYIE